MSNFSNKLAWNSISGYNGFLPTYFNGDLDLNPTNTMTGTADIVLRNGNIYTSLSGYINSTPIIKLNYLDVTSSIAAQLLALQTLSLSGTSHSNNSWYGTNTFNAAVPTTTIVPSTATQFATVGYVSSALSSGGGSSILGTANAWTGTNTFNSSVPTTTLTPSTATPTQFATVGYVSSAVTGGGGSSILPLANAWTNTNTFNSSVPTTTIVPSTTNQFATVGYTTTAINNLIAANNAWTGTSTHNSSIPTTTLTPSSSNQFATLGYITNLYGGGSNLTNINTNIGYQTGYSNTSGARNTNVGYMSGYNQTTGNYNTCLGTTAGSNMSTGSNNTLVGYQGGVNLISGSSNTFLGYSCGQYCSSGANNTAVGYNSAMNMTGSSNTSIGFSTSIAAGVNNSTVIGASASCSGSNQVVLGSASESVIVSGSIGLKADGARALYLTDVAGGFGTSTNSFYRLFGVSGVTYSDYYGDIVWRNSNINGSTVTETMRMNSFGVLSCGQGYRCKAGVNGGIGNVFNLYWSGSSVQFWIDSTNVGSVACDYRIKENIKPSKSVLNRLCNIQMFDFEHKNIGMFKNNGNHIGFYAHELQKTFIEYPKIVNGDKDALNENGEILPQTVEGSILSIILMKAIQELNDVVKKQQEQIDSLKTLIMSK
jgi:hypothetical protein